MAADAWYPGWEATVDGRSVPLYIADVAFRGLRVPAGEHRVEMHFAPRILYLSAAVSFLFAVIAGTTIWRQWPAAHAAPATECSPGQL